MRFRLAQSFVSRARLACTIMLTAGRRCLYAATAGILLAPGIMRAAIPVASQPSEQKDLKSLSLEELGNVEVLTYGKTPTDLWTTPTALYVITGDDILRSGVTNIADALRLAPGVEVGRLSSTTWAVGIRGLQNNFSKSVLVLIDGRNVYTPLFAGVYWDVQDMPLENIERIEVIRGPGGTIWGPNAANGVINIITKRASDTQGFSATALAGSSDHTIDDVVYGSTIGKTSYRVVGRGFERAHEYHTNGINEDAWHQERLGFRADRTSGHDNYFAEGDLYSGDSPHIIGTTPFDDRTSGGDINLRWMRNAADGSGFSLQAYFDRTVRTGTFDIGETRNTIDIDFLRRSRLLAKQRFSYGVGLHWAPFQIISLIPSETLIPNHALDYVFTGFLQDEFQLTPKFQFTVGAKLQNNNYSGFDIQPSARLLWAIRPHESLWLGASRAVTTPSDIEENFHLEGALTPTEAIVVAGDPHFKSEDLMGYEIGYRRVVAGKLYLDLAAFWNQYTRLQSFSAPMISSAGGVTYLTIQYQNQIGGSTSGFEIAPQFTVRNWWRLNSSYSFLNSNFQAFGPTSNISDTGSVSTYDGSTPKHLVNVQSEFDLPGQFHFDQTYRYASILPAQKVPAYQTMDVRLARKLGPNFTIVGVGQNLFQPHHYEWGTGDPTQPLVGIYRAAYIKLSFRTNPKP